MKKITHEDIVEVFDIIRLAYDYVGKDKSQADIQATMKLWFTCLKDFSKEEVENAVYEAIRHCEFAPKISTIVNIIEQKRKGKQVSLFEQWNALTSVLPSVCRYDYYRTSDEESEKKWANTKLNAVLSALPPSVRKFVGSVDRLVKIAKMSDKDLNFERNTFLKYATEIQENEQKLIGG